MLIVLFIFKKKGMIKGLTTFRKENKICQACIYGKHRRLSFPISTWRETRRSQLVHNDIFGPLETSFGGCNYFLLFIDNFSGIFWVYFVKENLEAFTQFQSFHNLVESTTGEKIVTLCIDNGGEFTSSEFHAYFKEKGIRRKLTKCYTPKKNGVTE